MTKQIVDLEEYIRIGEPSQRERAEAWQLAIGLQAVDQLHVSSYLLQTASEHVVSPEIQSINLRL